MRPPLLLTLACLAPLAGCGRYALVEPQPRTLAGVQVRPTAAWSRVATPAGGELGATEIWTIDGELLHTLVFALGIRDGEPLLQPRQDAEKFPRFSSAMTPDEIAALFEATLVQATGSSVVRTTAVGPAKVLGREGLRLDFAFTGTDEIDRQGTAVAAVRDGRLYLVAYQGTALLHYEKHLPEARRLMESAVFAP